MSQTGDLISDFIRVSLAKQDRERHRARRQLWLFVTVLTTATIIFAALAFITMQQRNEVQRQNRTLQAQEKLAKAEAQLNVNAECSLVWALDAYDLARTIPDMDWIPFENTLRRVMVQSHVRSTLTGHSGQVTSVSWNPDGKVIASVSPDDKVRLWDANSGEEVRTLPVDGVASRVIWSPDGKLLAISARDIMIWDRMEEHFVAALPGKASLHDPIAWGPNGQQLIVGADDGTAKLWTVPTGTQVSLAVAPAKIMSLSWSQDGQWIAVALGDGSVRLLDAVTGKETTILIEYSTGPIDVSWSPDGQWLAAGFDDGLIYVWNVQTKEIVATFTGHTNQVMRVSWSPDGRLLASASWDGTIRLWNLKNKSGIAILTGHTSGLLDVTWSPDGQRLASASQDGTIRIWDTDQSKSVVILGKIERWMWNASWSPDGNLIAAASDDGTIWLWNGKTGACIGNLSGHLNSVTRVAWSPDGQKLASASIDKTVRIWNVKTMSQQNVLLGHQSDAYDVAWSRDGKSLASAAIQESTIRLWDTNTGENVRNLRNVASASVAWSPDGRWLAFATPSGLVQLWDVDNQKSDTIDLTGHKQAAIWSLAWSPDGRMLASASDDDTALIWDVKEKKNVLTLLGHTSDIKGVAWSPDGSRLATASLDNTIRLWDAKTGKNIGILTGHTSGVRSVAWSPDGKRLVSASEDGTVRVFYANIDDVAAVARQQVTRGLTSAEREVCLGRPVVRPTFTPAPTTTITESVSAQDRFNQGMEYTKQEKYDLAMEAFRQAIAASPKDAELHIAICLETPEGMAESVLPVCDRAIELAPNASSGYFARGLNYGVLKKYDDAIADFDVAIRLDPKLLDAYKKRGEVFYMRGLDRLQSNEFGKAISDMEQADRDFEAYLVKPDIPDRDAVKEHIERIQQISEILHIGSISKDFGQGIAHLALEEYDLAMKAFEQAVVLAPQDAKLHVAICSASTSEIAERVLPICNQAVELAPNEARAYFTRGSTYSKLEKYDEAIADFNTTLRLDPKSFDVYKVRGATYFLRSVLRAQANETDKAISDVEKAIEDWEKYLALKPVVSASDKSDVTKYIQAAKQLLDELRIQRDKK